jgi:Protein of unknown function (DUF3071)
VAGYVLVKRLHLVGPSKDGKRLVFAQKKGAKFGSFEAPISPKLLKLIGEFEEAREAKKRKPAAVPEEAPQIAVVPDEAIPEQIPGPGPVPVASDDEPGPEDFEAPPQIGLVASDQIDIPIPPGPEEAQPQPLPGIGGPPSNHPSVGPRAPESELSEATVANIERIRPRTEKPEIPARSKLTPAEIQALIRAGRGIRAVANQAGTPMDWVRYLAEPIQEERRGIVRQMLMRRQERARLGMSAVSIGDALIENLRARGIRSPEDVIEDGFTAFRPDGREWRVRLVFDHRGRRQTANWSFDVQTRQVTPLNSLATNLGWRRDPSLDADGEPTAPRTKRAAPKRGRARTIKSTARKRTAGRTAKKTSATRSRRRSRG